MKSRELACVVALLAPVVVAQTPSVAGFADEAYITGLSQPAGMAFLPDGRVLICEQVTAAIKVSTGAATATCGTVPNVTTGSERGLLAIAVDPQWPTRNVIYVWYSRTGGTMYLSMYTMNGDLAVPTSTNLTLGNRYDILTDPPDNAFNHNGGSIRFGTDGLLYLSIGDDASSCNAQTLSTLAGCVLRLDVSGIAPGSVGGPATKSTLIPAGGNPWNSGSDNQKLHFVKGLRNPFRFHIDSVTNNLYIADVGQNAWEEISEVVNNNSQVNLGWPWYEGNALFSGTGACGGIGATVATFPIATLSHGTGAGSIMSMTRYRNVLNGLLSFGATYEGDYFYTDYYEGTLRRLTFNGTTWSAPTTFGTGYVNVSDAAIGPDGGLYYVKQFPGSVRRLKSTANLPTVTIVSGNAQAVNAGLGFFLPLKVQVTQFGAPAANLPVTFTSTAGGSTLPPMPILTDANGFAEVTPVASATFVANPQITATTPGANTVTFTAVWRGLTVTYSSAANFIQAITRHSQANSPVTLAFDLQVPTPFLVLPWGSIWTSILQPAPTCGAFDGLGLLGTPNPAAKTSAGLTYIVTQLNLPIFGGLPLTLQSYALDTAKTGDQVIMISNKVDVVLN